MTLSPLWRSTPPALPTGSPCVMLWPAQINAPVVYGATGCKFALQVEKSDWITTVALSSGWLWMPMSDFLTLATGAPVAVQAQSTTTNTALAAALAREQATNEHIVAVVHGAIDALQRATLTTAP